MKSFSSVCLLVCPPVTTFSQDRIISFFWYCTWYSWPSYLVTVKARVLKKTLGATGRNQAQNEVFCHFIEFGSNVFLEIAFNGGLHQCLTCIRDKTYEKFFLSPNLGQIGQNRTWNQLFRHFLKLGSLVFF